MKPKTVIIFILAGLFFIILLQNTQVVSLRLLFWSISMSRIILLPLLILIGFILGFFVGRKTADK